VAVRQAHCERGADARLARHFDAAAVRAHDGFANEILHSQRMRVLDGLANLDAIAIISKVADVLAEPGAFGLPEQFRLLAFAEQVELQGLCYEKLGDIGAAIPLFEKAVAFLAKSQDLEPNNAHCTRDIRTYNSGLGELKMSKGDYAEGSRYLNLGLNGLEDLHRRDPINGGFLVALADSQFRAARSFAKVASGQSFTTAQRAEAQQRAQKALGRCRELIQLPNFTNLGSGLDFRPHELDVVAQQLRDSSERN
jgi:tetratricopeptide (TPR) repeat protein